MNIMLRTLRLPCPAHGGEAGSGAQTRRARRSTSFRSSGDEGRSPVEDGPAEGGGILQESQPDGQKAEERGGESTDGCPWVQNCQRRLQTWRPAWTPPVQADWAPSRTSSPSLVHP